MFLDQLENMLNYYDLEELKRMCFCSVQSAPVYLLAKSKIRLNVERSHFWFKSSTGIRF